MKDKVFDIFHNKRSWIYISLSLIFVFVFLSANAFSLVSLKGNVTPEFVLSSNDNRANLSIENYNLETGFLITDTKKLKIKANFSDEKNINKKVIISLKEGLSFASYPVLEVKNSNFEKKIELESYLLTAVKNVIAPKPYNMGDISRFNFEYSKVSFGDLIYEINDNITSVEFNLNIKADLARFYEDKTISDAISIQVIETDIITNNEILSKSSTDIKLKAPSEFKINYSAVTYSESAQVFTSNDSYNSYGYTKYNDLYRKVTGNNWVYLRETLYKQVVYYLYYPKHTTFDSVFNDYYNIPDDLKIENKPEENLVIITMQWPNSMLYGFSVKYRVNNDAPVGEIISTPNKNKIVVTYYDGVQKTYEALTSHSVKVLDSNTFVNKLDILENSHYDDYDDETFIYAPAFVIKNNTPGIKTNQTLEFEIDSNYEVVKIHFPYDEKSEITNIKYKTTLSEEWVEYKGTKFKHDLIKKDLGLQDKEYFTAAKITVSSFADDYVSSIASPKSNSNAVVYGNLKSSSNSATVKFRTYDESNKDKTLTEKEGTITHPEKNIFAIRNNSSGSLYYKFNKENVYTGETFTINAQIFASSYPYGTASYVKDTTIYLREQKGTTLNPYTIKLSDSKNSNVPYELTTKRNVNGENIYILKTNYSVGQYFTEDLKLTSLKLSYDIKVNFDYYNFNYHKNEIDIRDLITWGADGYEILSGHSREDVYDINANGDTKDKITDIGSNKIGVLLDKNIAVLSYIEKDGIISSPYDESNLATIMDLHQKEKFNYTIKVKNNFEYKINGIELYLPIPKKYINFGEMFQTTDFRWNTSINGNISVPEGYSILYTKEVPSKEKGYKDLSFSNEKPKNINDVTMIKIYTEKEINEAEEIVVTIPFVINETRENLVYSSNTINVWNPVYYINTEQLSGVFKGVSVGVKLLNHEINGKAFYDNNGNGLYDNAIDTLIEKPNVKLYKLNSKNEYEEIEDANVLYDNVKKEFYFNDYNVFKNSALALKFDLPIEYFVSTTSSKDANASKADTDGWIKNIDITNANNLNIGFVKYELDFSVDDIILLENEKSESVLKITTPVFFDYIKNENIAYKWELVNKSDSKYVNVEDNNLPYTNITGLSKKDKVKVKATIFDKYGNNLSKEFNVKVVNDSTPKLFADTIYIYSGDKVDFSKFVKKAIDYKEREINLIWSGEKQNITYTSNILLKDGIATDAGAYEVTYTLKYDDKTAIKTVKIIVDDKKGILNPQTQDKIKIVLTLLGFVGGTLFVLKKIKD